MFQAMSIIGDRRNKEAAEKMARERELLKVSIKKEDVDLIARESAHFYQLTAPKIVSDFTALVKSFILFGLPVTRQLGFKFLPVISRSPPLPTSWLPPLSTQLWMRELEISRSKAERTLREHHGDVVQALVALTD
ncbi:unnamed protein product [Timema podura]|uniref:Nascent polypeptide-associated complex subunit alpha-like UBA domain-containing protein n=1 Tax=Timema podura TaxID=61482 RepID=A0ABN7NIM1_TIMPD|nr:unnamed protein product [Timema podura]